MTTTTNTTIENGTAAHAGPSVTSAIVRAPQQQAIEPTTFGELKELARLAAGSRFFGSETPEQALMILMAGRDLGFSYTQSLRMFHVIKGRPTLSADGMVAACMGRRDVCEYFRVEGDDKSATAITKRVGNPEQRYSFSMDDAARANLLGNTQWKTHPRRMLQARAKAFLARDVYPDLLAGLYDADEIAEARPAHVARETVVHPEPVVVYDPDAKGAFLDAINAAKGTGELKATASTIAKAKSEGIISPADAEEIRAAYELRMADLKAAKKAPPAPKSEPKSEPRDPLRPSRMMDDLADNYRGEDPDAY